MNTASILSTIRYTFAGVDFSFIGIQKGCFRRKGEGFVYGDPRFGWK
jgi:hypothetical protein